MMFEVVTAVSSIQKPDDAEGEKHVFADFDF